MYWKNNSGVSPLHRTLSMIGPCNVENLVGNVIVGIKQLVAKAS